MTFDLATQFYIYLQHLQPGEGSSRSLLHDCENFAECLLRALLGMGPTCRVLYNLWPGSWLWYNPKVLKDKWQISIILSGLLPTKTWIPSTTNNVTNYLVTLQSTHSVVMPTSIYHKNIVNTWKIFSWQSFHAFIHSPRGHNIDSY